MRYLHSAIVVLLLILGSYLTAHAQSEITLMAMGPGRKPTDKNIANFEAKTNYKVKVVYVNGVETRQLVEKGQTQDVNLVVAPFPGAVASGAIDVSSAKPVTSVVWVFAVPKGAPKPDISSPAAVKKALLAAKSIGFEDPDFTVAGQGPWAALTKLGIADQVMTKLKVELGPAARGVDPSTTEATVKTITHLENGTIDIALHDLNDLIGDQDKYQIVGVLPRDVVTPTPVVGFLSKRAKDNPGAKALLQYLASPEAQAIWKEGGMGAPEKWPVLN
jgi:molybdate transport system substrate-binding protein